MDPLLIGSASVAGVFATVLTHPLDTWAVHRQTGKMLPRPWRMRYLFKGVGPAVGQATLIYGAMLGTYEMMRQDFGFSITLAAAASAIPESLVKGPLEAIKNLTQCGLSLPRTIGGGARLFTIGFVGMCAREIPGNIAYFYTYEKMRANERFAPFVSGVGAATAFTVVAFPLDALRSQAVTKSKLRYTWHGVGPYWIRGIFVTGSLFAAYEHLIGVCKVKTCFPSNK